MEELTAETLQSIYMLLSDQDRVNEASEMLERIQSDPRAIAVHTEVLANTTDPRVARPVLIGLSRLIDRCLKDAPEEVSIQLRNFVGDQLQKCQSVEAGRQICETLSAIINVVMRSEGGGFGPGASFLEPLFELAAALISAPNYPRAVSMFLWHILLTPFKAAHQSDRLEMMKTLFDFACDGMQSDDSEIRIGAMYLLDDLTWCAQPNVDEDEAFESATTPQFIRLMTQLGEFLISHCTDVNDPELCRYVSACDLDSRGNRQTFIKYVKPLLVMVANGVANDANVIEVRNFVHEILSGATEYIIDTFTPEEIDAMIMASIKLALQVCAKDPEGEAWKNHMLYFGELIDGGRHIQVIMSAIETCFAGENPCERLVGLMLVAAVAEADPAFLDSAVITSALAAGDVDNDVFVCTVCQMIDELKKTPRLIFDSFSPIVEYLLKSYKYDVAKWQLPSVIKCLQKPPHYFWELFNRLGSLAGVQDMQARNMIIEAMGMCLSSADHPVEGFFDILAPILQDALNTHQDFAPAVLMCFGNLTAAAPLQISALMPTLMELSEVVLKSDAYYTIVRALKMIRKLASCLIESLEPYLGALVPILVEIASRPAPDSDEMYIESTRTNYEKMRIGAFECLCVIAREVDSLKEPLGKLIWEACSSSTDAKTLETAKYIHVGKSLFRDLGCDMVPFLQQLVSLIANKESSKMLKKLLVCVRDILAFSSSELSINLAEKISNLVFRALDGVYNGFLVQSPRELQIPFEMKRNLWRILRILVCQAKSAISPMVPDFITGLEDELVPDGSIVCVMFLQLASKMVFYCPEHDDIIADLFKDTSYAWNISTGEASILYHILMSFTYLVLAGKDMFASDASNLLEIAARIQCQAATEFALTRSAALALSGTVLSVYKLEVPDERIGEIIGHIRDCSRCLQPTCETMPLLVNFLATIYPRFQQSMTRVLPRIARAVLTTEPFVWGELSRDAIVLVLETSKGLSKDEWLMLVGMNQCLYRKVQRNAATLTEMIQK